MFKIFIVTVWFEYQNKLWVKYAMPLQSKCNDGLFYDIKKQFDNSSIDIVAIKCTRIKNFKIDKRIYNNEFN
jgi:uncharacterized protein YggU (UPF0235/DUF167 family)